MEISEQPVVKMSMRIRKPVAEVFEAFVNPDVTTKFWFNRATGGRLEPGKTVQWHWDIFDATAEVDVKAIEKNARIEIEWGDTNGKTPVEWVFTPRSDDTTYVEVTNSDFTGDGDEIMAMALDSTGGFALVLAAAKAYLEHGVDLKIVEDKV